MAARPPLDLSAITRQYELFREPLRKEDPVLPGDTDAAYCFATAPVRLGHGPDVWSTSTELVPAVLVCHDVNGYYRELGVHWQASRKELLAEYTAREGQSSPRLTYIFKQLLNPLTRQAYDSTPAGETFLDDYTTDELKRRAHQEAGRRASLGQSISADRIMDEWGYVVLSEDEVDSVSPVGKDQGQFGNESVSPIKKDQDRFRNEPWKYSYYAWNTASYSHNEDHLRQWQELLSTAASQRGVAPRVAIGMTALSDQSFMLEDVNGKPVVFFPETATPDLSVAIAAIELSLTFPQNPPKSSQEGEIS